MPTKLTSEIITAAILGFEEQRRQIDTKIAELRAMLPGGSATPTTPEAPTGKRKKISAAARRHMKEAQQRRWAKIRAESEPPALATPEAPKPKRRISKAGMARIIAATKERWARVRAAKAQQEKASRKAARKKAAGTRATLAKAVKQSGPAKKTAVRKTVSASTQAATEASAQ
jgi:hypothetical protein